MQHDILKLMAMSSKLSSRSQTLSKVFSSQTEGASSNSVMRSFARVPWTCSVKSHEIVDNGNFSAFLVLPLACLWRL